MCHRVWLGIFFVVSILLYIYKGLSLPYRNAGLGFELTFLVVYAMIDWGRLYLGSLGNLTETAKPLAVFVVLSLPLIFANVFFLRLQTYVLNVDEGLNIIALVLLCLEAVLGTGTMLVVSKASSV